MHKYAYYATDLEWARTARSESGQLWTGWFQVGVGGNCSEIWEHYSSWNFQICI